MLTVSIHKRMADVLKPYVKGKPVLLDDVFMYWQINEATYTLLLLLFPLKGKAVESGWTDDSLAIINGHSYYDSYSDHEQAVELLHAAHNTH